MKLLLLFWLRFYLICYLSMTVILGVAYSKHVVHIYSYYGGDDLRNHIEVLFTVSFGFYISYF